ncbi:MAG: hypothetical protein AAGA69_06655, partial [Pseudomonadota bacterium]
VIVARTLASLCLPEDKQIGSPGAPRLGAFLRPIADGTLPASWRDLSIAVQEADYLLALSAAFRDRRLSAPEELTEALKVARLYIGGFITDQGGIAQLPGRQKPDFAALERLQPVCRQEASILLEQMGYASARHGNSLLVIDLGTEAELFGTGGVALTVGSIPVIINCGRPSDSAVGLIDRMAQWSDALISAPAASSCDLEPVSPASLRTETGAEGTFVQITYSTAQGDMSRSLLLSSDGKALTAEDNCPSQDTYLRLHIGQNADTVKNGEAVKILFGQDMEMTASCDTGQTAIEESVSAWTDGQVDKVYQIVMSPCEAALRWRINWAS